jgi:pectinesterase
MPRDEYRAALGPVYEAPGMHTDIAAIYRHCAKDTTTPTSCTAVVWVAVDGFQARNLTVSNTYDARRPGRAHQAVAFKSEGADRVHLEQVHLLGHQDTLYLRAPAPDATARTFVHRSLVAGDVDFIFGPATAYFLRSEIRWVGARRGLAGGWVAAPSTNLRIPYGFVFEDCDFTSDSGPPAGTVHLARQWFTGATCSPYGEQGARCAIDAANQRGDAGTIRQLTLETVGKMAVLNSRLGAHLRSDDPWAPWQTDRAHRAYRPAQRDSDAFWNHLAAAGRDPAALGYTRTNPPEPYLAEYRNRVLTPR